MDKNFCGKCGQELHGEKFCPNCGTNINGGSKMDLIGNFDFSLK